MEFSRFFIILTLTVIISKCFLKKVKNKNIFGEFVLDVVELQPCELSGPIDRDIFNNFNITWKKENGKTTIYGTEHIERAHKLTKATYIANIFRDGEFKQIFNKTAVSPCNDPIIGRLLTDTVARDENCVAKKGNYTMQFSDLNYYAYKIVGKKFYYGKIKISIQYFTKFGLSFCIDAIVEFKPSIKKSKKTQTKAK